MCSRLLRSFVLALCLFGGHNTGLGVDGEEVGMREGWKPGGAGSKGDITTQICYRDPKSHEAWQMIVLSNELGAAAVRVTEEDNVGGINWMKYEYRYESFDLKTSTSGRGEVFEQQNARRTTGGSHKIVVNDLQVDWSPNSYGRCWLYYSPELIRVQTVTASFYGKQSSPLQMEPEHTIPALDLQRFKLRQ